MFNVLIYGVNDKGFGQILSTKITELDLNQIDLDKVAIIILQDEITRIKRYIFGVTYRALLIKNNVENFYKSATFSGKDGSRSWAHIVTYNSAELFIGSPLHVLQMMDIITKCCKDNIPFWQLNNIIKEYSEKYHISCFTNVTLN